MRGLFRGCSQIKAMFREKVPDLFLGMTPFPAVIIPAALPLARGLAANQLLRVIWCRLKDLLTVRAATIIHQAAPDQNASGSL
jgi:hypothetical protein